MRERDNQHSISNEVSHSQSAFCSSFISAITIYLNCAFLQIFTYSEIAHQSPPLILASRHRRYVGQTVPDKSSRGEKIHKNVSTRFQSTFNILPKSDDLLHFFCGLPEPCSIENKSAFSQKNTLKAFPVSLPTWPNHS